MQTSKKVPAIVSDIDGVLILNKNPIPKSAGVIRFLKSPLKEIDNIRFKDIDEQLPFVCLTNGGESTERRKAETISNILGLTGNHRLNEQDIVVNFTPLRPIFEQYKNKLVMLGGSGDLESLAQDLALTRYITDEEYGNLFPVLIPYGNKLEEEAFQDLREKVLKRLQIEKIEELHEPFKVDGIFIFDYVQKWENLLQIVCDLLSSHDGKIPEKMPKSGPEKHIPIYCTHDDALYADAFRLPRICLGAFNRALKDLYKQIYKRDMQLETYGKPSKPTFEYTEKHIKEMTNLEISNFYMIGDNPKSDIRGGNKAGWVTILVKTGVFHPTDEIKNDPEDPANYVVEDFAEAVKLICELEEIKCEIK